MGEASRSNQAMTNFKAVVGHPLKCCLRPEKRRFPVVLQLLNPISPHILQGFAAFGEEMRSVTRSVQRREAMAALLPQRENPTHVQRREAMGT